MTTASHWSLENKLEKGLVLVYFHYETMLTTTVNLIVETWDGLSTIDSLPRHANML